MADKKNVLEKLQTWVTKKILLVELPKCKKMMAELLKKSGKLLDYLDDNWGDIADFGLIEGDGLDDKSLNEFALETQNLITSLEGVNRNLTKLEEVISGLELELK